VQSSVLVEKYKQKVPGSLLWEGGTACLLKDYSAEEVQGIGRWIQEGIEERKGRQRKCRIT
jgi:hypothetical protein